MAHRLALAMGRTVKELSAVIDNDEWMDWLAYYSLEPWGIAVEDDRWEKLLRITVAATGTTPPNELYFDRDPQPLIPQTVEQKETALRGFFAGVRAKQAASEMGNTINT